MQALEEHGVKPKGAHGTEGCTGNNNSNFLELDDEQP